MKTIFALLALSFSVTASASVCYQIYSPSNLLVWQGKRPPVPLDHPAINDEVGKLVPGGHLVIADEMVTSCRPFNAIPEKPTPRKAVRRSRSNR